MPIKEAVISAGAVVISTVLALIGVSTAPSNNIPKQDVLSGYVASFDISPTLTSTPTPTGTPMPTNTPTPSPTLVPFTSLQLEEWFTRYSNEYGSDRELLKKIALCESGFNTTSYNAKHGYAGMYQFSASTWHSTRTIMELDPNLDLRFNPEEAIKTAAFKISRGGAGAWPNCSR